MKNILVFVLAIMLLTACSAGFPGADPTPTASLTPLPPATATPQPTNTATHQPTATPYLTATPDLSPLFPPLTSPVAEKALTLTTSDGVKLSASLYGDGPVAVILAHMGFPYTDQLSWQPFARYIAAQGYTALTFDFRGYGHSEGSPYNANHIDDLDAVIAYLREAGYKTVVCVGASMGGSACLRAAVDANVDGLAVIAGPFSLGRPTHTNNYEMKELKVPSLYIVAEKDFSDVYKDIKEMAQLAPEPKQLIIYPDIKEHATNIFYTEYGAQFRDSLVEFLATFKE